MRSFSDEQISKDDFDKVKATAVTALAESVEAKNLLKIAQKAAFYSTVIALISLGLSIYSIVI